MEQDTIEPEYEEKKEFEIKINENKLKIEMNEDEILFELTMGLSCHKYTQKYK